MDRTFGPFPLRSAGPGWWFSVPVKLLLTSGGITNPSIREALVGLLSKPIEESDALVIPTAQWGHPLCGPVAVRGTVAGVPPWGGMTPLPWRTLGLLELTALPHDRRRAVGAMGPCC